MYTEIKGKAYVHWKSWNEAYKDIIPQSFLERRTLEHCLNSAYNDPANTYIAILEDTVVGFVSNDVTRIFKIHRNFRIEIPRSLMVCSLFYCFVEHFYI